MEESLVKRIARELEIKKQVDAELEQLGIDVKKLSRSERYLVSREIWREKEKLRAEKTAQEDEGEHPSPSAPEDDGWG